MRLLACAITISLIAGCAQNTSLAPVTSIGYPNRPSASTYQVQAGDTLYSIAWSYGMDYQKLATLNHLAAPYAIHPGQRLQLRRLAAKPAVVKRHRAPVKASAVVLFKQPRLSATPVGQWLRPVPGGVWENFSKSYSGNPGIDYRGWYREPVRACANGVVVYSGAGVRGYGNLILLKHGKHFLSAYAFNQANLVRQGDEVKRGQVIARMGRDNAGRVLLHFEVRRDGKPVNPLLFF